MEAIDSNGAIKGILRSWTIGGIIPTKKHKVIFYIYSVFINIFVNVFYPCTLIGSWIESNDIRTTMENLSFHLSIIACTWKHFTIFFATNNIRKMTKILQKLDQRAANSHDEKNCIEFIAKLCNRIYYTWLYAYCALGFLATITKLFAGERLIYPAWFPFDLTAGSNASIAYGYQFAAIVLLTVENSCLDSFPTIFLMVMAAHIEVLGLRIKKIGGPTKGPVTSCDQLTTCIEDHKDLLRLFEEVSAVIKGPMTVQLFVTAFSVCTAAVNIMFFATTLLEIFAQCCYSVALIFQVFPACYCMNRIIELNASLTGFIYQCNWPDQDLKFKKTLIIFMQNTQKDLVMMAGNIAPINLSTFISIIKISFSMFTILRKLN